MKRRRFQFPVSLFRLVALGIALGYGARFVFGPPAKEERPLREFTEPLSETVDTNSEMDEFTDLPIIELP